MQAYFILANLVAVPLTASWVMPAGLLALLLMPLGLERLALAPMGWALDAVLWVARTVAALARGHARRAAHAGLGAGGGGAGAGVARAVALAAAAGWAWR